jgi:site-specific DNA-methyltransferase (adenine-specific)
MSKEPTDSTASASPRPVGEKLPGGVLFAGDALEILPGLPSRSFQCIVADPPYFQVLTEAAWDNAWSGEEEYLQWTEQWVRLCLPLLRPDGLLFLFGQPGKREQAFLHLCSRLLGVAKFHDLFIWDRVVGYNQRKDSFNPQYEMILVLRPPDAEGFAYFDKTAGRTPYDPATIRNYLGDKRYQDKEKRARELALGRPATNILRIPSLKGNSKEKAGHPSQKPLALVRLLIEASTRPGDAVLDPFLGSGSTAVAARELGRPWTGIELSPDYHEIIRQRLAATLGL